MYALSVPSLPSSDAEKSLSPSAWERSLLIRLPIMPVRLLLGLVSVHMLVISASLAYAHYVHQANQEEEESLWEKADLFVVTWASMLMYGGVCGLIAAACCGRFAAKQCLAAWVLVSLMHTWYLVFETTKESGVALWDLVIHMTADALGICLLILFLVVLVAHEKSEKTVQRNQELEPLVVIIDGIQQRNSVQHDVERN